MPAAKGLTTDQLQAQAAMAFQGKPPKKYWGDKITLNEFQQIVEGSKDGATSDAEEWVIKFCTEKGIPYYAGRKCVMCNLRLGDNHADFEHPYHKDCVPSCMWCGKECADKASLEAHEDECTG